ncbi:hypothetical protein RI367_008142 [Sorochytrium milnesiophthora]
MSSKLPEKFLDFHHAMRPSSQSDLPYVDYIHEHFPALISAQAPSLAPSPSSSPSLLHPLATGMSSLIHVCDETLRTALTKIHSYDPPPRTPSPCKQGCPSSRKTIDNDVIRDKRFYVNYHH